MAEMTRDPINVRLAVLAFHREQGIHNSELSKRRGRTHKEKKEKVKMALETVHIFEVSNTKDPIYGEEYAVYPILMGYLQFVDKNPLSPNPAMVMSQNTRRTASTITIGKGSNRLEINRKAFAPT